MSNLRTRTRQAGLSIRPCYRRKNHHHHHRYFSHIRARTCVFDKFYNTPLPFACYAALPHWETNCYHAATGRLLSYYIYRTVAFNKRDELADARLFLATVLKQYESSLLSCILKACYALSLIKSVNLRKWYLPKCYAVKLYLLLKGFQSEDIISLDTRVSLIFRTCVKRTQNIPRKKNTQHHNRLRSTA